jgi:hypothetical protein
LRVFSPLLFVRKALSLQYLASSIRPVYRPIFLGAEMAKRERWLEIPTELSLDRFREFVLPHLTVGSRGPDTKLSLHALFNYILKQLHLGRQHEDQPR